MIKFICYPKCTTCQRAKKWLDDNNIQYGMLVKRPLLIGDDFVLLGFKEAEWNMVK